MHPSNSFQGACHPKCTDPPASLSTLTFAFLATSGASACIPILCPHSLPSLGVGHTTATSLETFCQGLLCLSPPVLCDTTTAFSCFHCSIYTDPWLSCGLSLAPPPKLSTPLCPVHLCDSYVWHRAQHVVETACGMRNDCQSWLLRSLGIALLLGSVALCLGCCCASVPHQNSGDGPSRANPCSALRTHPGLGLGVAGESWPCCDNPIPPPPADH